MFNYYDAPLVGLTATPKDEIDRNTYSGTLYDNLYSAFSSSTRHGNSSGALLSRSDTHFDDRGRVYRTVVWAVNPSTGALGNSLTSNTWYDAGGNEIKSLPAGSKLFTKTAYDILGRVTIQYVGFDVDETTYAEAQTVTGDTILEQQEMSYNAVGAVLNSVSRQRYHDAPATNAVKDFYQQIRRPLWWPDDVRFPTPTGVAQQSLGSP